MARDSALASVYFTEWSTYLLERIVRLDAYAAARTREAYNDSGRSHELIDKVQTGLDSISSNLYSKTQALLKYPDDLGEHFDTFHNTFYDISGDLKTLYDLLRYLPYPWPSSDLDFFVEEITASTRCKKSDDEDSTAQAWSIALEADLQFSNVTIGNRIKSRLDPAFPNVLTLPCTEKDNPAVWALLVHEVAHTSALTKSLTEDVVVHLEHTIVSDSQRVVLVTWIEEMICDLFAAAKLGPAYYLSLGTHFAFWSTRKNLIAPSDRYPSAHARMNYLSDFIISRSPTSDTILQTPDLPWNLRYELEHDNDWRIDAWEDAVETDAQKKKLPTIDQITAAIDFIKGSEKFKNLCGKVFSDAQYYNIVRQVYHLEGGEIIAAGPSDSKISFVHSGNTDGISLQNIIHNSPYSRVEIVVAGVLRQFGFSTDVNQSPGRGGALTRYTSSGEVQRDFIKKVFNSDERIARYHDHFTGIDEIVGKSIECANIVEYFRSDDDELPNSISEAFYVQSERARNESGVRGDKSSGDVPKTPTTSNLGEMSQNDLITSLIRREIIVSPLISHAQVNSTIDLRLGTSFIVPRLDKFSSFDPVHFSKLERSSPEIIDRYFENIVKAQPNDAFILESGQSALACTLEFIYLPRDISGSLEGRSGWARTFLNVHSTASFIHPGHRGVIVFELKNAGGKSVHLYPGMRVAQLKCCRLAEPSVTYDDSPAAKYNSSISTKYGRPWLDSEFAKLTGDDKPSG